MTVEIDRENEKYPLCITWTVVPVVTAFLPFVGHPAICDKNSVHHDFSFPNIIHSGKQPILGKTLKYIKLEYGDNITDDDLIKSIEEADKKWKKISHKYFYDNCHDYVVDILNGIKHKNKDNWTVRKLMGHLIVDSTYVNGKRKFYSIFPSIAIWGFISLILLGWLFIILYQLHLI